MAFKRAIPRPTAEQQRRQDLARELGCICCRMESEWRGTSAFAGYSQIHHLTEAGRQLGQDETVCCCSWHHQGHCLPLTTTSQMTAAFGPSLAKGSKTFYARYGRNEELLEFQNALLEKYTACA